MKKLLTLSVVLAALPVMALAQPHIEILKIQDAVYKNPECIPEEDEDECLTYCDISFPVFDGIQHFGNQKALNVKYKEKAQQSECSGKQVAKGLLEEQKSSSQSLDYKTLLNDGILISLSEDRYEYQYRAAHGTYSTTGIIIDSKWGKELGTADILDMKQVGALNDYIVSVLKQDDRVFDSIRNAKEPASYISDTNREFTLMLDKEKGLYALFGLYQIGPYVVGEVDVAIPSRFIKHPHIKAIVEALEHQDAAG